MPLINIIQNLYKKYIYSPHQHDWIFDRTIKEHINVCGLETDTIYIVYKCSICGESKVINK